MPGRKFTSSSTYRYGFNGKENDKETVGTGDGTQDYGARIYNPALGRFLSVDPDAPKYPFMSPYCFAANNPIKLIDENGKGPIDPRTGNRINSNVINVTTWSQLYSVSTKNHGVFSYDASLALTAGALEWGDGEGSAYGGLASETDSYYNDRVVSQPYIVNVAHDNTTESLDMTSSLRASKGSQGANAFFDAAQNGNYGFVSEDLIGTNFTAYEVQDGWINRESYFSKVEGTKNNYYMSKQTSFTTTLKELSSKSETKYNGKTGDGITYKTTTYQVDVMETVNTYDKKGKVTSSEQKTYSYTKDKTEQTPAQ